MKKNENSSLRSKLLFLSVTALVLAAAVGCLVFTYADFRATVLRHLGEAQAVPRSSVELILEACDASQFVALPCIATFLVLVAFTQFRVLRLHQAMKNDRTTT